MKNKLCENIISNYMSYIQNQFECRTVQKDLIEIITPYRFSDNDFMSVYVEQLSTGSLRLSDFGEVVQRLGIFGFSLTRKSQVRDSLELIVESSNGVILENGALTVVAKSESIGAELHELLEVMRQAAELVNALKYNPRDKSRKASDARLKIAQ